MTTKQNGGFNYVALQAIQEGAGLAETFVADAIKKKNPTVAFLRPLAGLKGGAASATSFGPKGHTRIAANAANARWERSE